MLHPTIERYLRDHDVEFQVHQHPRAITAQETAEAEHVSGWQFAKAVAVELASGEEILCVVPAPALVDLDAVCDATQSKDAVLVEESRMLELFPGCELGAEPPLGGLYGLPVLMDPSLKVLDHLLMRGGTHEDALVVSTADYLQLEQPKLAKIATLEGRPWRHALAEETPEPHAWHHR